MLAGTAARAGVSSRATSRAQRVPSPGELRHGRRGAHVGGTSSPGRGGDLSGGRLEEVCVYLTDPAIELVEGNQPEHVPDGQPHHEHGLTVDLTVEPSLESLRLYLRDIARVSLLTAGQEVSLAKRVERGDMAAKAQMIEANPAPRRLD